MDKDRERIRQSHYPEYEKVVVEDGVTARHLIDGLQGQLAESRARSEPSANGYVRQSRSPSTSGTSSLPPPGRGISLNAARRLLGLVAGSDDIPSINVLRRATAEAGRRAGELLKARCRRTRSTWASFPEHAIKGWRWSSDEDKLYTLALSQIGLKLAWAG
jgi:hypothetical protein